MEVHQSLKISGKISKISTIDDSTMNINYQPTAIIDIHSTSGYKEFVNVLKTLTEAVINQTQLNAESKNQIIEQLLFLAHQANLPEQQRKTGVIKGVLSGVRDNVSTVGSLLSLWNRLEPLLHRVFS